MFAWEAHHKGVDVNLMAEPTKLELLQKQYDAKKDELKSEVYLFSRLICIRIYKFYF